MKVTIEMIADALGRMYPEITVTYAFRTLAKLGELRSTKDIGIEVQILQKTFKDEIVSVIESRATPEPTPPLTKKQPTDAPSPTTAPVGNTAQLPEFLKDIIKEVK